MDHIGPYVHSIEVSKIRQCSSHIRKDPLDFGISCTKGLLNYQELIVSHSTDIHRLKVEAKAASTADDADASVNSDFLVIYNATLLTMDGDGPEKDLLHDSLMIVAGGEIVTILGVQDAVIPYGAMTFDAQGGTERFPIRWYACADDNLCQGSSFLDSSTSMPIGRASLTTILPARGRWRLSWRTASRLCTSKLCFPIFLYFD